MVKFMRLRNYPWRKVQSTMLAALMTIPLTFSGSISGSAMGTMTMNPATTPDYFGTPNYANSPLPQLDAAGKVIPGTGIRKFVDSLPGLGAANANDLGQYIPLAVPDTTTYPGSDYYEISLVQYTEQLHKDLPPTTLRGYEQTNTTDSTVSKPSYFGPMILAEKDRPVRVKFTNKLPTGSGGDLFLPVDTSLMGAGMGPDGTHMYTQNRGLLHLHGGITPWISDGTPHQWITPAGEDTPYPKGVSVQNVPDMPDPGPGSMTFFYTNQQSARMMWYHDHSYGITRLNVYAGEAAGYILRDQVEKDLIASGIIPADEIPLIIQDKTFVPDDAQLAATDPTWDKAKWGGKGNLWFPHVYMPNQNPYDMSGANPMGRWDYGPWFWPPNTGLKYGPVPNPLSGMPGQPPNNPGVPNISAVPESFMDTPLVNGTAYPYLTVQPKTYRFRILNAANDRSWNLQLYKAKSNGLMWNGDGTLKDGDAGEVPTVPSVPTQGFPNTWPTDGRDGGVPDPAAVGPKMIQIGTDSGLLPNPVELENQPINYEYNRRSISVLNVSSKTLLLGPAERADVVVDFSQYAGKTLILYNDGPAPIPAFDSRYDYYTGDPDQSATGDNTGGAPTTLPGYGPNTRTIMQIRIADNPTPSGNGLSGINIASGGAGYTSVPGVSITGGGAITDAAATATISVSGINLGTPGAGYTSAPNVHITDSFGGTGTGAAAKASLSVAGLTLTNPGAGYTSVPAVTITESVYSSGTGSGATAAATIDPQSGTVTGITVTNPGNGYTAPVATVTGGGATTDATATVTSSVYSVTLTTPGAGYTAPLVTLSGGGAQIPATATATGSVDGITLTNPGVGYTSDPMVTFIGGGATTSATAQAVLAPSQQSILLQKLQTALPAAFAASQNPLLVPNTVYGNIMDTSLTFTPAGSSAPMTLPMQPKAIVEEFSVDYGRMNATLGAELPNTNFLNQTSMPLAYIDPANENLTDSVTPRTPVAGDGTQIWKVTHNGVDSHSIHFHLFDVQLINRVGWDGSVRWPDPNETGWKDTVRMNPLEDAIVALRPIAPKLPFAIPDSIRPLDPTMPLGTTAQFTGIDPKTGNAVPVTNELVNFGWEYVWHCHLLGHEENDMMRPIVFNVARSLPGVPALSYTRDQTGPVINLNWSDPTPVSDPATLGNPSNEIGFLVERAAVDTAGQVSTYTQIGTALANTTGFIDTAADMGSTYSYRVVAYNAAGNTMSNAVQAIALLPATPTNLTVALQSASQINMTWTDNAANETGFTVERSTNNGAFAVIATLGAHAGTGGVSYSDSTVSSGNSYSYRVMAVNGNLSSAYSNIANIIVPAVPAAPTNLTAVLSGQQVNLTWIDNAADETGFMVERSTNNGAFTVVATPAPLANTGTVSYSDTSVTLGSTYTYRVSAVNGVVASAYSNAASITVLTAPVAPSNLAAIQQSATQVNLTWIDNSSNETGFTVERATYGGAFSVIATPGIHVGQGGVSYSDNTVTPGNTYTYRVTAVNGNLSSTYSNQVFVIVAVIPTVPTNLTATATAGRTTDTVVLRWNSSNNVTGFLVQRATDAAFTQNLNTTTVYTTLSLQTGLAKNTIYYYRVQAVNKSGSSPWTATVSVRTP